MLVSTTLDFWQWLTLIGCALLVLGLSSAHVKRLPMSTSALYLALGFVLGPSVLGWVSLKFASSSEWFERLTEVAVIIALFISGLKLRMPIRDPLWIPALRLAGPVMVACIGALALFVHYVLQVPPAHALLLGAVLAPTDPVLAGSVAGSDASDKDRVRYGVSGEAGLNDGTAFPFVVLALEWLRHGELGAWLWGWAAAELLWAVPVGLALGFALGTRVGRLAIAVRSRHRDTDAPSDFVAISVIALSYASAELVHAWGFLAVFAAGVGLRNAERDIVAASPHPDARELEPDATHPPAEHLVAARVNEKDLEQPAVAAGALVGEAISFGGTAERLLEIVLVTLVGTSISSCWDWRALAVAAFLFLLVRPFATQALLTGTQTSIAQRGLMGWFSIRGIGSLYYLAYALNHGVEGEIGQAALSLTLPVIAVSILVHGTSATPLLNWYERRLHRKSIAP